MTANDDRHILRLNASLKKLLDENMPNPNDEESGAELQCTAVNMLVSFRDRNSAHLQQMLEMVADVGLEVMLALAHMRFDCVSAELHTCACAGTGPTLHLLGRR